MVTLDEIVRACGDESDRVVQLARAYYRTGQLDPLDWVLAVQLRDNEPLLFQLAFLQTEQKWLDLLPGQSRHRIQHIIPPATIAMLRTLSMPTELESTYIAFKAVIRLEVASREGLAHDLMGNLDQAFSSVGGEMDDSSLVRTSLDHWLEGNEDPQLEPEEMVRRLLLEYDDWISMIAYISTRYYMSTLGEDWLEQCIEMVDAARDGLLKAKDTGVKRFDALFKYSSRVMANYVEMEASVVGLDSYDTEVEEEPWNRAVPEPPVSLDSSLGPLGGETMSGLQSLVQGYTDRAPTDAEVVARIAIL